VELTVANAEDWAEAGFAAKALDFTIASGG
jgi:hypothetical protein